MPKPKPVVKNRRINITMPPALLKKVDAASGHNMRSAYIADACTEKLATDEKK